jgi:hypothetical protein
MAAGGAVAGLVLNAFDYVINNMLVSREWQEIAQRHNVSEASMGGTNALVIYTVIDFLVGFLIVWTYAAIRPRYGPGPKTASTAAVAVWGAVVLATAFFGGWFMPWPLLAKSAGLSLVAYLAAGLAGAAVYRES